MTIIVFLVDTSASMQQKAYVSGRSSLLDVAKGAVEFFVKMRQKSQESRGDRYMLLTFEEYPRNIKAGWKENLQTFMNELKNLEASGMTTMGSALKQVFDILNINRMQTGIDMYGQGRYPFYLEPAVIIVISDGGKLTTQGSVQTELNLPMHSTVPGSELTREPFRWDQRLYALVLRMAGTPPTSQDGAGHVANDNSPIDAMCEVTGGRSYMVTSQRVLHQCIDSLVQKLQFGVVIHFEKIGPDPPPLNEHGDEDDGLVRADTIPLDDAEVLNAKGLTFKKENGSNSRPHTPNPILSPSNVSWHNCRKLIYVPRSAQKGFAIGFWPLPESFVPDSNSPTLVKRSAHPNVKFTCINQEPMIIDNLPFDKYELEPSPLTLYILARKQPKVSWQVYIQGSGKGGPSDTGQPFGYLKASTNLLTVNLFVLPYNYPVLLPLLDELFRQHRLKPTNEWKNQFNNYLKTMPPYYAGPLRRALTRMSAGNLAMSLIPDSLDNCLGYTVTTYLKRLKNQAKVEYDKTLNAAPVPKSRPEGIKIVPRSPFKKELLTNSLLKDKFVQLRDQQTDFPGFALQVQDHHNTNGTQSNRYRNPFDIPRHDLLDQIVRMRSNYLQPIHHTKLIDEDSRHSLPISQMGNYQDYLKKMPVPLKELESTPVRQHMFGNPFKINKNILLDEVVDEIGLAGTPMNAGSPGTGANGGSPRGAKRPAESSVSSASKRLKKGPLPRDFVYRSRSNTPASTPIHDTDYPNLIIDAPLVINEDPVINQQTSQSITPVPVTLIHQSLTPPTSPYAEESNDLDSPPQLSIPEDLSLPPMTLVNGGNPATLSYGSVEDSDEDSRPTYGVDKDEEDEENPLSIVVSNESSSSYSEDNNNDTIEEEPEIILVNRSDTLPEKLNGSRVNGGSASPPLNRDELRSIKLRNQNVRQIIYKEVKRPGKNHDKLLRMLKDDLHGPSQIRRDYIKEVIQEAFRFKRKSLAELLLNKMDELIQV